MYKTTVLFFLVIIVALSATQSCSKDKTQTPNTLVCDSTKTYSYTADVKPIFDVHCASIACHSSIVQASGINLSDYTNSKEFTQNSKVLCVMNHTCSPVMPQGAPKLSDSLIRVVECWAAKGFQN
jgi:hypothetical protein